MLLWARHIEQHFARRSHQQGSAHLATPVWRCQEVLHAASPDHISQPASHAHFGLGGVVVTHGLNMWPAVQVKAETSLGAPRTWAFSISPKRLMMDDTLTTRDGAPAASAGSSSRVSR